MPSLPGGDDPQLIQLQLRQCLFNQRSVGVVRRIERTAKHTHPFWLIHQTQSLGLRNLAYNSPSGVPGSGRCW